MVICHTLNNFYEMIHAPPHGMHYFIFSPLGAPNGLKFNFKYRKCIRGVELKILHGCLPYFYENQCATTRNTSRTKPSSKISICCLETFKKFAQDYFFIQHFCVTKNLAFCALRLRTYFYFCTLIFSLLRV